MSFITPKPKPCHAASFGSFQTVLSSQSHWDVSKELSSKVAIAVSEDTRHKGMSKIGYTMVQFEGWL
jgi:hypothetical protein